MSPALPVVTAKQCLRALQRAGFYIDHQRGSHARLLHYTNTALRVTVPIHPGDLTRKNLRRILNQAHLTADKFLALL